ncbi:MAG: 50S ribosomal protein L10 [Nanoarchaeales archaeon]|nr:50S ribosomal protein L10 [Nanoarchaeales archaeon]
MAYAAKVSPKNELFANKIRDFSKKYSILGIVDVTGLPAPQFQKIRSSIKKTAEVLIVKRSLINLVLNELESSHPGVSQLVEKCSGVVGIVFTNDNPFTLFKFVQKNKSNAPAKGGQIAPCDIVVPAGPTAFAPGPIIGELGAFKIKAGISNGKVEIKEDSIVAKEGDVISDDLAGILTRLGIEPMEVGLNIKAIYEGGTIYDRAILDVDEDAILADLKGAASDCFKLSIGLEYYTGENISHFITEAGRDSLGLGVGVAYPAAETIKALLAKANASASGVGLALPAENRPAGLVASAASPVATEVANEESKEETKEEPAAPAAGLGGFF